MAESSSESAAPAPAPAAAAEAPAQSPAEQAKEKGNAHFAKGEYVLAVNAYNQAIKLDPNNAALYSNRAVSFLKLGKEVRGLKDAQTAIDLKPDWPKGYFRKAACLEKLQRYEEALEVLKVADEIEPGNREVATLLKTVLAHHPQGMEEGIKIRQARAARAAGKAPPEAAAAATSTSASAAKPKTTETSSSSASSSSSATTTAATPAGPDVKSHEDYEEMKKRIVPGAPIPYTDELAAKVFQEALSMVVSNYDPRDPKCRVFFQPGFYSSDGNDGLGIVGIDKAFESPEVRTQCAEFLRKYGADFKAIVAVVAAPKEAIAFPQVWSVHKRDWSCRQDCKGVFLQMETPSSRKIVFIPAKRDSKELQLDNVCDLNVDRFEIMPRLLRPQQ